MQRGRPFLGKRSSFSNFSTPRDIESAFSPNASDTSLTYDPIVSGGGYPHIPPAGIGGAHSSHQYSQQLQQHQPSRHQQQYPPQQQQLQSHMSPYTQPMRPAYYETHWPLYSFDWTRCDPLGLDLVSVASFSEDQNNRLQILRAAHSAPETTDFELLAESSIVYPPTKVKWEPQPGYMSGTAATSVRLISTGDCLRLWEYDCDNSKLLQRCALLNKPKSEYMPPLTSFDWNSTDPSLVVTSSIDTTCTIWDIATSSARTQLIAHDSEVYDVTFVANSVDIFSSVGADGSVRVFDLRALDHSTIIYEPTNPVPLLRIAANPFDSNLLATIAHNSTRIHVLDIRLPGVPVATLEGHQRPINSISWAPGAGRNSQKRHLLASAADDCQVLLWDLTSIPNSSSSATSTSSASTTSSPAITTVSSKSVPKLSPVGSYTDNLEVNNIAWNTTADWLGLISGRGVQAVRFI